MDPNEFNRLLQKLPPVPQQQDQQPPQAAPALDMEALGSAAQQMGLNLPTDPTELDAMGRRPDGTLYSEDPAPEPGLGDPSGLDAIAGGSLQSVFETKDFLFGDTPEDQQSDFRRTVEEVTTRRQQESLFDGFSAEVAQFATAMIGLGKLRPVVGALPWVGAGLGALGATRKGAIALETGKAALAGAVAFDPHEERLSNVIQDTALANPLNAWLAADPEDSAAEGRLKAAMESIGMDAVLLGTFVGASKVWKYLRKGEVDKAGAEAGRMETEARSAIADEETRDAIDSADPSGNPAGTGADSNVAPSMGDGLGTDGTPVAPQVAAENARPVGPDDVAVEIVSTSTEATQSAGVEPRNASPKPAINLADEDTTAVLSGMEADAEAIAKHGGWYEAIEAGHTFGRGEGIPYRKLNTEADVDDFMARVVDASEERLDALKGGAILTDARVQNLVDQRAKLFGDDPALLLGMLQKSGKQAAQMVADMEAGYLVATRMFQDAYSLAARINLGDFVEAGSKDKAVEELKRRLSIAASVYGAARSVTANSGRALRRMRGEFKVDPEAVKALQGIDPDALTELLVSTKGNPRNIAKLVNGTMMSKVVDLLSFIYVNNLVSGPMTQFINMATNGYMLGARPLERILGSIVTDGGTSPASRAILRESTTQFLYMGHAFTEGFRNASKAFLKNDSILAPHRSEVYAGNNAAERVGVLPEFRPWNSTSNTLFNVFAALPVQALGLPTRTLGAVDELMKQTTYRSKVMAGAYWEAVDKGAQTGLQGKDLDGFVRQYVADKMDAAFDAEGRGVNAKALHEANITTFQQDLLPNTIGKWLQTGVTNNPFPLRLILPFVKTPTNVLRYGWKMSPGLNMLQTEYRGMLRGEMGPEAKRQAMGQMALGSLFIGSAATIAAQGRLTGAGPQDPKARASWMAAGGKPYSVWWQNEDGSVTSVAFNRYDPIAIPFGIIADLQSVMHAVPESSDQSEVSAIIDALKLSVASQMRNKTYLMGISQALEAVMDPERSGFGSQVVANFLPFSAAQRQFNPDPYLREARDLTDKLMATIPGLSENVPARYDAFGDPIEGIKGLWSSKEPDPVDLEVARLAMENGSTITRANPYHEGVDLRDLTLSGEGGPKEWQGKNAYAVYQELAGHLPGAKSLKEVVGMVMASEPYRRAPDGDMATKGTKLWMLYGPVSKYRSAAMKMLTRDKKVQDAFLEKTRGVMEHYRGQAPRQQQPQPGLNAVGEAFGIDLEALTGPAR